MSIPGETRVGNLTVIHVPALHMITIVKKGIVVPIPVHEINYDTIMEAEAKQAEAIAWAEQNCA